ncbi:MAG: MFS transporter [Bifidobacteriaceae bacterium]|jgi:MFS family permease|nr:MFS transporter [Bifidobacteriaceae bacterium]
MNRELVRIYVVNAQYSLALGVGGVMLTYFALARDLDLGTISLLTALSAVTQMGARLPLGWALRYVTDRFVMLVALATLIASMMSALAIPGLAGLVVAQLLQGTSRAGFWSASQTHVIRAAAVPVKGLSRSTLITSACSIAGPLVAGWLAGVNLPLTAWVVAAAALLGFIVAWTMRPFPVFKPPAQPQEGKVWRRPGVRMASAGALVGGAWHVTLSTFVPVVLTEAGWRPLGIGVVGAIANGMLLVGTTVCGQLKPRAFAVGITIGGVTGALGIACLGLASVVPAITIGALVLSGAGTGAVMTLGPALAAETVHAEERGAAVVVTGSFRAGALLAVPLAASGLTLVLPVALVMSLLGTVVGLPVLAVGHGQRRRTRQAGRAEVPAAGPDAAPGLAVEATSPAIG